MTSIFLINGLFKSLKSINLNTVAVFNIYSKGVKNPKVKIIEYKEKYNRSTYDKYGDFKDHNVKACSGCKEIDLSTAESKYSATEACNIMLGYVNDLRKEVLGSGYALKVDQTLLNFAKIRAKEISTNFSHSGGTYTGANENIINSGSTVYDHFKGWKSSSGHYNNMVRKASKYFGYAFYHGNLKNSSAVYGVQLFWEYKDQHES